MNNDFVGTTFADKFRIESLLRTGETGDYYRAINIFRDEPVTLKIVAAEWAAHEEVSQAFQDEAKTLRLNEVRNLLRSSDSGIDAAGNRFIVIESLEGKFLDQILEEDGKLTVEKAIDIAVQTAKGAHIALMSGQMGGTLSKYNIFVDTRVDRSETVKLVDTDEDRSRKVHQRMTVDPPPPRGTEYLAPEIVSSAGSPDEISTVYSIGVLLYEMLAGESLFGGDSITEVLKQKLADEPPPPLSTFRNDVSGHVETAIIKALSKNPEARQQTLAEFTAEIALEPSVNEAAAETPTAKPEIWKTAFIVLAAISLLTVALIYATSVKQTNPATQLKPDANGQPVQPIGPATGIPEQNLANMQDISAETISNSNMAVPPGTLPGGDGYDPWKNGGKPPPGAPAGPGGQVVTIDPNNPSPFMTNDGPCIPQPSGIVLCPAPANRMVKPSPTPKNSAANANVVPKTTPTPETKPSPTVKTPARPTPTPKPGQSGKPKNGDDL